MSKLLQERMEQFNIPPLKFKPAFDRVVIYPIGADVAVNKTGDNTFVPGGLIVMPDKVKDKEDREMTRGVLLGVGLGAQDHCESHGIGVGHVVWFAKLSPWNITIGRDKEGKSKTAVIARSCDLIGSEDLLGQITSGEVNVVKNASGDHCFRYSDDSVRPRFDPPGQVDQ